MDELQLKFTEAVAKSNYINTTIVPLCESFFKTVMFSNYHVFVAADKMKVSLIVLIAIDILKIRHSYKKQNPLCLSWSLSRQNVSEISEYFWNSV